MALGVCVPNLSKVTARKFGDFEYLCGLSWECLKIGQNDRHWWPVPVVPPQEARTRNPASVCFHQSHDAIYQRVLTGDGRMAAVLIGRGHAPKLEVVPSDRIYRIEFVSRKLL